MRIKINEAAQAIKEKLTFQPEIAIILGSGLGPLANEVENEIVMDYSEIPHFPASTIPGHEGKLVMGTISGKKVIVMKGRFHYYEGHDMSIVTLPTRVFAKLGIKYLLVTNAAGGVRDDLNPGDIMLINDHLSFLCPSPLMGPNLDEFGPRFKDMTEVYNKELMLMANEAAKKVNVDVKEGVYSFFKGPMYETPAEIRGICTLGADAVGMSTVPEAIVARHCGMTTLGISLITNKAAGLGQSELNHVEVTETAANAEKNLIKLAKQILLDWII
ncbi:MAG: purine-nucleoside phosphorylase [Clostridiales bacterium]|nr:purine-nucleoside phosphorylase [Clostridiales bacterium]